MLDYCWERYRTNLYGYSLTSTLVDEEENLTFAEEKDTELVASKTNHNSKYQKPNESYKVTTTGYNCNKIGHTSRDPNIKIQLLVQATARSGICGN